MTSGVTRAAWRPIGVTLINTVFLSLLVTTGLLMAPVSCMCGASVPHGHSLFQLPSHNHASASHDVRDNDEHHAHEQTDHMASLEDLQDDECDEGGVASGPQFDGLDGTALSNAMEKQDGAVLQAPPSSSLGQPVAFTQPAMITMPGQQSEALVLPPARVLEGLDPSPEIPPPRFATTA